MKNVTASEYNKIATFVKPMEGKITRHAFVDHRTKIISFLTNVLSTRPSFGTIFTSLSAFNYEISLKNIHTYIHNMLQSQNLGTFRGH